MHICSWSSVEVQASPMYLGTEERGLKASTPGLGQGQRQQGSAHVCQALGCYWSFYFQAIKEDTM